MFTPATRPFFFIEDIFAVWEQSGKRYARVTTATYIDNENEDEEQGATQVPLTFLYIHKDMVC